MLLDSILSLSGADRAGLFLGEQETEAPGCPGHARADGPSTHQASKFAGFSAELGRGRRI